MQKPANNRPYYLQALLRGGRLTKFKGQVASFAPHVGALAASVSPMPLVCALAVGGALMATGASSAYAAAVNVAVAGGSSNAGPLTGCTATITVPIAGTLDLFFIGGTETGAPQTGCTVPTNVAVLPNVLTMQQIVTLSSAGGTNDVNFTVDTTAMGTGATGLFITGPILTLGAGNDSLIFTGNGSIQNGADLGAGNDTLDINSTDLIDQYAVTLTGAVSAGDGNDVANVRNIVAVGQTIDGGNGDDQLTVGGINTNIGTLTGGNGNDELVITGGTFFDVLGGADNDKLMLTGGTLATPITVTNIIDGGTGNDEVTIDIVGTVGTVDGQLGNDSITLAGGTVTVGLFGGAGNDTINWTSATATTPSILGGDDSDTVNINDAAINLTGVVLDGGGNVDPTDGEVDTLNLNNAWTGNLTGANTTNWETININGGTVGFSDAAITAGTLNVTTGGTLDGSNNLQVTASDVNVDATSFLVAGNATGNNAMGISGNLTNAGTIDLRSPAGVSAAGDKLTVNGNYTGSGGTVKLDTVLGGDASATDRLLVNGNVSGNSSIAITNIGGTGAQTGVGINLVEVSGTSAAGSFSLASPLYAGAYQYALKQGGFGGNANDWYLVSAARPSTGNYVSGQAVNREAGLVQLSTYHQRMGDQRIEDSDGKQTWLRPYYVKRDGDGKHEFNYRSNITGLQLGQELLHTRDQDITQRAALTFDYAHSDADFKDQLRPLMGLSGKTGSLSGRSLALGATYSRSDEAGGYLDLVGQYSWLRNKFSDVDGGKGKQDGRRLALSVEAGKPIADLGHEWKLEPQGQLIWMRTAYDSFTDSSNLRTEDYTTSLVRGRLGARIFRDFATGSDQQQKLTAYGIVNVLHTFSGSDNVTVAGSDFSDSYSRTQGEVGAGLQGQLNKTTYLYGDMRYQHSLNSVDVDGYQINLGARIAF